MRPFEQTIISQVLKAFENSTANYALTDYFGFISLTTKWTFQMTASWSDKDR